jgi:dihydropteroate synthase
MTKVPRCGSKDLDLTGSCIMGILNVTPDSFSDGGQFFVEEKVVEEKVVTDKDPAGKLSVNVSVDKVLHQAGVMVQAGAKILDIGGESTRPGAQAVSLDEERERVLPVVAAIKQQYPHAIISVDTSKPELMAEALDAGCDMVNDVNALQAPGAIEVLANSNAAICLMHMQGEPRTMQYNPHYNDVVQDVFTFLQQRVMACLDAGITRDRLVIDPGFGFGKKLEHNLLLMKHLAKFKELGTALLVGVSRKSMIGALLDKPVENRLIGSVALATLAVDKGADIVRVHDVDPTMDVIKIINAVESV